MTTKAEHEAMRAETIAKNRGTSRNCLLCRKPFKSQHAGIQFCTPCKRRHWSINDGLPGADRYINCD